MVKLRRSSKIDLIWLWGLAFSCLFRGSMKHCYAGIPWIRGMATYKMLIASPGTLTGRQSQWKELKLCLLQRGFGTVAIAYSMHLRTSCHDNRLLHIVIQDIGTDLPIYTPKHPVYPQAQIMPPRPVRYSLLSMHRYHVQPTRLSSQPCSDVCFLFF